MDIYGIIKISDGGIDMQLIKDEVQKFMIFLKEHYVGMLCFLLLLIFVYFVKIFFYSISIDTEVIINDFYGQTSGWVELGRYSLKIIKKIFNLNPFNYHFSNLMSVLFLISAIIILYYIFYRKFYLKKSNLKFFVFSSLIATSPILAEQLNFTLQSFEVTLCFIIFDLGVICILKETTQKKYRIILDIISILCFVICLGCYQSFMVLLIAIFIIYITMLSKQTKEELIKICIRLMTIVLLSLIGYLCATKIFQYILKVPSSSYLSSQIKWISNSVFEVLKLLIIDLDEIIFGKSIFYNFSYLLAVILTIYNIIKNKKNKIYCFMNIFVLLSPFTLMIFMGQSEAYRAQFTLPIVVAFISVLIFNTENKVFKNVIYSLLFIVILIQSNTTFNLFSSDYHRYVEDEHFATEIMSKINDYKNNQLVFVGYRTIKNKQSQLRGETMGYSFFEWDIYSNLGVNSRAIGFMQTLGYDLLKPTIEQYEYAKTEAKKMDVYPSKNSILYDNGLIIIRLS